MLTADDLLWQVMFEYCPFGEDRTVFKRGTWGDVVTYFIKKGWLKVVKENEHIVSVQPVVRGKQDIMD